MKGTEQDSNTATTHPIPSSATELYAFRQSAPLGQPKSTVVVRRCWEELAHVTGRVLWNVRYGFGGFE